MHTFTFGVNPSGIDNFWENIEHHDVQNVLNMICGSKIDEVRSDDIIKNEIETNDTKILDFGCGIGRNLCEIPNIKKFDLITGYDNQLMLDKVPEFFKLKYNSSWNEYSVRNNISLESDWKNVIKNNYDVIYTSICFQHISEKDLSVYISDIKNITKRLIVMGRTITDESTINDVNYKTVWNILAKNGLTPYKIFDTGGNIYSSIEELNINPLGHFVCAYKFV